VKTYGVGDLVIFNKRGEILPYSWYLPGHSNVPVAILHSIEYTQTATIFLDGMCIFVSFDLLSPLEKEEKKEFNLDEWFEQFSDLEK